MQATARASRVVVPQPLKWHGRLAARAIFVGTRLLASTIRFKLEGLNHAQDPAPRQPAIFCIWHNRLALCLILYERFVRRSATEQKLAAMVSASRDGGLLARTLEIFKAQPVRGSSSRRGPQALLELTTWAERGYDIAITPDGPRGPCYKAQEGVMALAQLTGRAVIPVSYSLDRKITLKSWDRFQIPLPFTVCRVRFGPPIVVPRGISDAEREELRKTLESELRRITID